MQQSRRPRGAWKEETSILKEGSTIVLIFTASMIHESCVRVDGAKRQHGSLGD